MVWLRLNTLSIHHFAGEMSMTSGSQLFDLAEGLCAEDPEVHCNVNVNDELKWK